MAGTRISGARPAVPVMRTRASEAGAAVRGTRTCVPEAKTTVPVSGAGVAGAEPYVSEALTGVSEAGTPVSAARTRAPAVRIAVLKGSRIALQQVQPSPDPLHAFGKLLAERPVTCICINKLSRRDVPPLS